MSENINDTLKERGARYGQYHEHARIAQNIKRAMQDSPNWATLPDYMKEALEMNAHKTARILNGDPFYADSWHDIIGYTKLVEDRVEFLNSQFKEAKVWNGIDLYEGSIFKSSGKDGWITWEGGSNPIPHQSDKNKPVIEILKRNGETDKFNDPWNWFWGHEGSDHDIMAYRVCK